MLPPVSRVPDWEDALFQYLAPHNDKEFIWGRRDCMLFPAGAVCAITGFDLVSQHAGKYKTHLTAFRYLKRIGFDDANAFWNNYFEPAAPADARRGDLVMSAGFTGVCIGSEAVFVGEENGKTGLVRAAMADWDSAWKIG